MSAIPEAVTTWLSPDKLADVIADKDYLLGMLRNTDWAAPKRAADQGMSVFQLLGGEATAELRKRWACYVHLAHMYRVILAVYEAWSVSDPVDEADYDACRRWWLRFGTRRDWGDPDTALTDHMLEMSRIDWGYFRVVGQFQRKP